MEGEELATRLYRGTKRIEQLRDEIKTTILLVTGLIRYELHEWAEGRPPTAEHFWIEAPDKGASEQQWALDSIPKQGGEGAIWELRFGNRAGTTRITSSFKEGRYEEPHPCDVVEIHSQLSCLVKAMTREFPRLSEELKPFIDAAS